jgi:hypothetical protein
MKLKIEIDIDYLSDEGSIDEQVQNSIASKIVSEINQKSMDGLTEKAEAIINERANKLVQDVFDGIMEEKISITDQWGKVIQSFENTRDMIKSRFDKFMLERVDNNGRVTDYGDQQTRMELIVKKQLEKIAKEWTQKAIKEVTEQIKTVLSDDLKLALGDRLINMMEIDKIIHSKKLNP